MKLKKSKKAKKCFFCKSEIGKGSLYDSKRVSFGEGVNGKPVFTASVSVCESCL
jgi:hypothetical protein|tara:strand:- start:284 stop:445 length:162 start_codon:yes stop_codon:yes gene_type:complete